MKNLMKILSFCLIAGAASAQTSTPSQNHDPNNPPTGPRASVSPPAFETIDTDRDGNLSSTEFDGAKLRDTNLAQLDRNSDGTISRDEWNSYKGHKSPTDRR